ncbi:MAG: hypothetical protein ABSA66_03290 [Roseiarcus sp.]|jgi:hypothetical protein
MSAMALYGRIAAALLLGAGVTFLPAPNRRLLGALAAVVALFSLAPVLHGWMGPPSFTLTQLALLRLVKPHRPPTPGNLAAALLVALASVFYPLALGLGPFDPFDLGYRPQSLLLFLAPVGLWLAWRRQEILLTLLGFDLLAYGLGLFDNLLSALFDPLLVLLAAIRLAGLARPAARALRARMSRAATP